MKVNTEVSFIDRKIVKLTEGYNKFSKISKVWLSLFLEKQTRTIVSGRHTGRTKAGRGLLLLLTIWYKTCQKLEPSLKVTKYPYFKHLYVQGHMWWQCLKSGENHLPHLHLMLIMSPEFQCNPSKTEEEVNSKLCDADQATKQPLYGDSYTAYSYITSKS